MKPAVKSNKIYHIEYVDQSRFSYIKLNACFNCFLTVYASVQTHGTVKKTYLGLFHQ